MSKHHQECPYYITKTEESANGFVVQWHENLYVGGREFDPICNLNPLVPAPLNNKKIRKSMLYTLQ